MKPFSRVSPLFAVFFAVVLSGCGFARTPLTIDAALSPDDIDELVVLPVIDARPSRFDQVQVARNVDDAIVRALRERGYFTLTAEKFRERPPGPLDLHVAGPEQLIPLAPEDAKFFLLVQVESLEPGTDEAGVSYEARLAAVMVDRVHAKVVWRDIATASSSLSGMLTVFSRGSRQYEAAVNASRALVETLPNKLAKAAAH